MRHIPRSSSEFSNLKIDTFPDVAVPPGKSMQQLFEMGGFEYQPPEFVVDKKQRAKKMERALTAEMAEKLFPLTGERRPADVMLMQLNKEVTTDELIALAQEQIPEGYVLGTFEHALGIGLDKRFREGVQPDRPVIALGSVAEMDGQPVIPYLSAHYRHFHLASAADTWNREVIFIIVPERQL